MTEAVQIALIIAIPPTLVAVGGLYVSILNRKQGRAIADKTATIEIKVDGKMEELLELTRSGARAAGVVEGREQGVVEKQARVAEAERVEDRAELKATDKH